MHDHFQTPQIQGEGFGSLSCLLVLEMKMILEVFLKQKKFTTNGQKYIQLCSNITYSCFIKMFNEIELGMIWLQNL